MSEHVLPPLLTEAEREALEAGADACRFLIGDSSLPEKWREWERTLRALASRKPREGDVQRTYADLERRMYRMFEHGRTNNTVSAQCECQALRIAMGWTGPGASISPADVPLPPSAGETSSAPGVCGTCVGTRVVSYRIPSLAMPGDPCPDCTGRVAASDAKETTRGWK